MDFIQSERKDSRMQEDKMIWFKLFIDEFGPAILFVLGAGIIAAEGLEKGLHFIELSILFRLWLKGKENGN